MPFDRNISHQKWAENIFMQHSHLENYKIIRIERKILSRI